MRQLLSIFFAILFVAYLATPLFIVFFDNSTDISYIHSYTEQEKNNSELVIEESENKQFHKMYSNDSGLFELNTKQTLKNTESNWSTIYFDINLPPPELL
ncbi:hypothetical protein [uncultured Planktosalinus sp.]|uniref:hypothetical protein n=1 Tax=uncultured Planktosalinus sp. TaxID=1810935 RepID=UPI0030D6D74E